MRTARGAGLTVSNTMIHQAASTKSDPFEAVRELHAALAHPRSDFTAIFCSKRYDQPLLEQALREFFGGAALVGCTTAGEISTAGYTDGGMTGLSIAEEACVAVSDIILDISHFKPAQIRVVVEDLQNQLRQRGIEPASHNTFALMLIDGMCCAEEQVISTLNTALGGLPLFGGSAGDDMRIAATQVLYRGRFYSNAATLTLVHTVLPFRVFSSQHFVGNGEQAIVTGADPDRRIITELNGDSAGLEYARMVGCDIEELRAKKMLLPPLVVRIGGSWYARSPSNIMDDNSLKMACAIDEGVPLSIGRNTGMIPNLKRSFEAVQAAIGSPVAVLGIDCVMRRVEATSLDLGPDIARLFGENRVIGFSAYGEQINGMHLNNTFTGIAFGQSVGIERPQAGPIQPASADTQTECERLEHENTKLRKTIQVLLRRIERSMTIPSDTFSLFQNNVLLEKTVQLRTEDIVELNRKLSQELIARREVEVALTAAKAEAERANLSKTNFLASVSHDLQQPLNAARLLLGALMEEDLSSSGMSLLGRIEGALEAAEEMLADFLDVSKLEAGGFATHPSHFAIGPQLAQLEAEYAPQARRKGLSLRIVQSGAVLHTDKGLLQRILRNFLANAIRYTRSGRVLVGCRRRGDQIMVEVHDNGIGIPKDRLQDIFEPYRSLDAGGPNDSHGSGLGLTIAKNFADILGLKLVVQSTEGRGSTFAVCIDTGHLPRAAGGASLAQGASAPLAGRRILVLDDDIKSRDALTTILGGWGCETLAASTVEEAISLSRKRPDLMIIDFHLEDGLTALDVLDTLKKYAGQEKPALVISADQSKAIPDQLQRRGLEFLPKPINPARLRSLVTYVLYCQTGH